MDALSVYLKLADGLTLNHLVPEDAGELHRMVMTNEAHLAPWMPWVVDKKRRDDTVGFIEMCTKQFSDGRGFNGIIRLDGALVGCCGYNGIDVYNRSTTLGYWLSREHTGKGIMSRVVTALVDHAFLDLELHRIEIRCATENRASRAIPERLGFHHEGTLREAEWLGGQPRDLEVYALISPGGNRP